MKKSVPYCDVIPHPPKIWDFNLLVSFKNGKIIHVFGLETTHTVGQIKQMLNDFLVQNKNLQLPLTSRIDEQKSIMVLVLIFFFIAFYM